ncbi:hypothetical protein TTHERM_000037588 (macronuclear) [Tetrahymena thermophila SB210]|uniref:Uncharacterized protein n=1 Tax=Tetrahymena thermophila (strain SB210) TaxID=312017 RepID=W7XIT6_TETTS|nr:hypothetical protein TTHERM_000037588 [Tetrahymena thermophila SB210]EWS74901.1 hypothetical protein TTHERM_000037588 [Tetrahymena thermophila SB210]|eukprot:XP_012652614.1 hypothetical protein TTHERM_000037588 [Tetrahymena thermophila SB210]
MRFILLKFFNNLKNYNVIIVNFAHHQGIVCKIIQIIDLKQKNNNINNIFQKCKVNKKIKYIKKIFKKKILKLKTKDYQRLLTYIASFLLKNNIQLLKHKRLLLNKTSLMNQFLLKKNGILLNINRFLLNINRFLLKKNRFLLKKTSIFNRSLLKKTRCKKNSNNYVI